MPGSASVCPPRARLTAPLKPGAEPASNFHILGARMPVGAAGLGSPDQFTARLLQAPAPLFASRV